MPYRSRSPLRATAASERISRQLCAFGRYPERRPQGLRTDGSGAFLLADLMHVWGRHEGLQEQDVLDAVRRHMFHDGAGGGTSKLRFTIEQDKAGRIVIRVMPKRAGGEPTRAGGEPADPRASPAPPPARPRPQLTVRSIHGSVLQQVAAAPPPMQAKAAPEVLRPDTLGPAGGPTQAKAAPEALRPDTLGLAGGPKQGDMDVEGALTVEERRANVLRACEKMGLTAGTRHLRGPPRGGDSRGGGEDRGGSGCGGNRRRGGGRAAMGERVQRWLSWALRHGHRELMIGVEAGGWAVLREVAGAMARSRPDLGDFDAQGLGDLLEETDEAGRFEVNGGKLRKLGRDQRQPHPARRGDTRRRAPSPMASAAGVGTEGSLPPARRRGRSRSLSSSSARSRRRGGSPSRSASPPAATPGITVVSLTPREAPEATVPPPPPGQHWTMYQDGGKDWFYYEGPLGHWWCMDGSTDVQRYEEEAEG